jgi:hypothetical protein
LLLKPSQEPQHAKAGWLKGHQSIVPDMWGWGVETQAAGNVPQVRDHSVHLDLSCIGDVIHSVTWETSADHSRDFTSFEMQELLSSAQISTESLIERLQTLDPRTLLHSGNSNKKDLETPAFQFHASASRFVLKTLRHICDQASQNNSGDGVVALAKLYEDMLSLLALSASDPVPDLDHFADFGLSKLRQQLCDISENHLVLVRCPDCLTRSSFRAHLWQQPTTDTQLYLVPGLTYQYTALGGVGILLDKGQIVGRARFCAAPCSCNEEVTVKVS